MPTFSQGDVIKGAISIHRPTDNPAMLGLGLIISGVVVLNAFSKSIVH